jgi:hypothetical protein
MISNLIIPALFLTDGFICAILAIFAYQIGVDPNPNWGTSRYLLLLFAIILWVVSFYLFSGKLNHFTNSEKLKTIFLMGHVWSIIFIIYAWFITFGNFTTWKNTTRYYTQLADSFGKGQLYIDAEIGSLAKANDPYNNESRPPFDDEIWDMSLYKGKLYIYWGPIPALLITPIQLLSNFKVTDIYLVYFFFCGLLIFNTLILLKLRKLFFVELSIKYVIISIFIIGLILPILWSLNQPDVYEAAIGAGQFFLMGGIYFIILAFEKDVQKRYLFLAGFFWACSVGSRAINVFPIIFLTVYSIFMIWKSHSKNWNNLLRPYASLLAPLLVGAFLIGAYNYARFDSPFEFGLRYQITIYNLNRDMPLTFQPNYLPLNLYAYFFQPFTFTENFPFIEPIKFLSLLSDNLITPTLYAGGPVIGILFYAPLFVLAVIPFFSKNKNAVQKIILTILGITFLINLTTILFYFYSQMRFMVDVISQITLLAVLGYWYITHHQKKFFIYPANLLIVITLITSFLLSFSSETNRMEKLNPDLMQKINSFFVGK